MKDHLAKHPPVISAEIEIATLRDGLRKTLTKLGFTAQQLAKAESELVTVPLIPVSKPKRLEIAASRALFFAARFFQAVRENDWNAAACYALHVGRAAGRVGGEQSKKGDVDASHKSRKQNTDGKWQTMLAEVREQIAKLGSGASAARVHANLKVEARYKWNLRKFQRAWTKARLAQHKTAARK